MTHLSAIAGLAIITWTATGCSHPARPTPISEFDDRVAQAIAQGAPTQTVALEATVLGAIPLDAYSGGLDGGQLRARELVLLPGGTIAVHSHDHRPVVVYVLEGEFVEHRSGGAGPVIRRQGDLFFETADVVHWAENATQQPARALAVDIVPRDPGP